MHLSKFLNKLFINCLMKLFSSLFRILLIEHMFSKYLSSSNLKLKKYSFSPYFQSIYIYNNNNLNI